MVWSWSVQTSDGWIAYDAETNAALEAGWLARAPSVHIKVNGYAYVVHLKHGAPTDVQGTTKHTQQNLRYKTDRVVQRARSAAAAPVATPVTPPAAPAAPTLPSRESSVLDCLAESLDSLIAGHAASPVKDLRAPQHAAHAAAGHNEAVAASEWWKERSAHAGGGSNKAPVLNSFDGHPMGTHPLPWPASPLPRPVGDGVPFAATKYAKGRKMLTDSEGKVLTTLGFELRTALARIQHQLVATLGNSALWELSDIVRRVHVYTCTWSCNNRPFYENSRVYTANITLSVCASARILRIFGSSTFFLASDASCTTPATRTHTHTHARAFIDETEGVLGRWSNVYRA